MRRGLARQHISDVLAAFCPEDESVEARIHAITDELVTLDHRGMVTELERLADYARRNNYEDLANRVEQLPEEIRE